MDIGSILLFLALVIFVAAFILRPLQKNQELTVSEEDHELSGLLAERDRILDALSELEIDYGMGKVPEAIYPTQRTSLMTRGAEVLRRLDEVQPEMKELAGMEKIEDPLEAMISSRKQERTKKTLKTKSEFCHNCGEAVLKSDRFCTNCGESLT